jgi:hypothetical protein
MVLIYSVPSMSGEQILVFVCGMDLFVHVLVMSLFQYESVRYVLYSV